MFAASKSGSAEATDAQFNYVTMLLHGDGTNGAQNNTFVDSSTNNFSITRNGNTTQGTFTPYGSNWSNFFDGSGDYLSGPSNAAFATGTNSFTIEGWVFLTGSTFGSIISTWNSTSGTVGTILGLTSSNYVQFSVGNGSGASDDVSSASAIPLNTWTHVAGVRNGSALTIYINGTSAGTGTTTRSIGQQVPYIGAYYANLPSSNCLTGYISNARFTSSAVYTSSFTPSTTPLTAIANTQLLTCQSNRFIDNSSNAFAITVGGGTPSVQRFSPFSPTSAYSTSVIGGSGYFDGSGDWLSAAQNAAFNLGTGAFTVEAWINLSTLPSPSNAGIITLGNGAFGGSQFCGWGLWVITNGTIVFERYDGTEVTRQTSNSITLNQWNHIVAVRDGSSNFAIYINGVRGYSAASATTSYNNVNSDTLQVGRTISGAGGPTNYLTGYIGDVRVVAGTAVYSPTSSTLTVPTAPLTAVTNTQLLLSNTNAGILDNAMMNDLETVGNAQISTSVKKYGTGSIAFDGTGDYLAVPSSPNLGFGSGDFTVEAWVYLTANIANAEGGYLTDFRGGSTSNFALGFIGTSGVTKMYAFIGATGADTTGSATVTLNTWNHVAFVRSGSTVTLYLNGTSNGTLSASYSQGATNVTICSRYTGATEYITGYIDDLRISKVARYTSNFTAPTTTFPDK